MRRILITTALATAAIIASTLTPAFASATHAAPAVSTVASASVSAPLDGGDWGRHRRHRFGRFGFGFPFASPFVFSGGFGFDGFGGGGSCIILGGELFCPVI